MRNQLENNFIEELGSFIELSKDAICRITGSDFYFKIQLGIVEKDKDSSYFGHIAFGSEVDLSKVNKLISSEKSVDIYEINHGSMGAYDPSCKESYWRTIHAANILKNWDEVVKLIEKYYIAYDSTRRR